MQNANNSFVSSKDTKLIYYFFILTHTHTQKLHIYMVKEQYLQYYFLNLQQQHSYNGKAHENTNLNSTEPRNCRTSLHRHRGDKVREQRFRGRRAFKRPHKLLRDTADKDI